MKDKNFVPADDIRSAFSAAMSQMYRTEVPAYGTLMDLVQAVNAETLDTDPELAGRLRQTDGLDRISDERHGAIRLGTKAELSMMRRVFAVMGMFPVGYYDLSASGVPVHSTAFRPVGASALARNPFRVFTSLLRLDLIADEALRQEAETVLNARAIFTPEAVALTERFETEGGLDRAAADRFVLAVLETFRWHDQANVSPDMYHRLHDAHRLVADVVSFKGPHINHLTPRTLDIDAVQARMPDYGITPKAVVEGPPRRNCPILLRQTSFKALEEPVSFRDADGTWKPGSHTARFGEVESRGIALTPKGRTLYDSLLDRSRDLVAPKADGSNADAYRASLAEVFAPFPDTWEAIRAEGLGYFEYALTDTATPAATAGRDLDSLIADGLVRFDPVIYEDFLPVSAAGIFQSNLGDEVQQAFQADPNKARFEDELGASVLDEFAHYADIERVSIDRCLGRVPGAMAAA